MSKDDSPMDEKSSGCPQFCSSNAELNDDVESGKGIRAPTWRHRLLGFGKKPDVTTEVVRRRKSIVAEAISETETRSLESCPSGYPQLSCFLSSESGFSLYRAFGYLHSRVLLQLQDELVALEKELDDLDRADEAEGRNQNLKRRRYDERRPRDAEDGFRPRKQILADIHQKLLEYDGLIVQAREMQTFQKPSERDYRSVRAYFWNEKPLSDEKEAGFIKKKEDIISLRSGREWSGFDGFVENTLRRLDGKLVRKLFVTQELRDKTKNRDIHYYSSSRVEKFVGLIITSIIFILLILPVVGMYKLTCADSSPNSTFQAIGVLIVFTLLFSAAMSLMTKARRHELFAAAAAYCAVLVVFISNLSSNGNGPVKKS
ncbi:uncharacterized protein PV09_07206 [Verruconis gallopava]|uniref:DUF6594 domain-containing protein n=1 Tax=Verruconis gallopava TaxID=253628 RepID=A0A0D2A3P4_9PEZI|nr:uncharacterized protein PV09_07206 [Verruconis gallopava]KIW01448.1 hypothetical protein PV09_07206 [Verruconis gallopava]